MKQDWSFRPVVTLAALVIASGGLMPAMASAGCYDQGKSLKARQAEATALKVERDELLVLVEDAGDAWEEAAATRGWTAEQTATANETKAEYEALKDELYTLEADLQSKVASLNEGVAAYNKSCATKK